jgi:sigma54-dependent transcription regulator
LPELGERFEGSLADLPARIAREAVRNIGALAAGDPAAWRGAKRMRSAPAIRTARLSLAWRMLFTVDQKEMRLRALAVIHRSDLEQALAQYR